MRYHIFSNEEIPDPRGDNRCPPSFQFSQPYAYRFIVLNNSFSELILEYRDIFFCGVTYCYSLFLSSSNNNFPSVCHSPKYFCICLFFKLSDPGIWIMLQQWKKQATASTSFGSHFEPQSKRRN
jgi:hypothetical protein